MIVDAPPSLVLNFPMSFFLNDESIGNKLGSRDEVTNLGKDFLPGEWDVVCGRGKHSFDHVGNRRFRIIVAMNLKRYVEAKTRLEKSVVVNAIVDQIREASPNGGFVKRDKDGVWFEIGDEAREKVGHALRDSMTEPLRRSSISTPKEKETSLVEAQNAIFKSLRLGASTQQKRAKSFTAKQA